MGNHFFQKTGHELLRGNMMYMRLPLDVKGMYADMRMMVDDQTWVDGSFPLGASRRATEDDLISLYSDGTRAKGTYVSKCLKRLIMAGVIKVSRSGVISLSTFLDEQALGNPEAKRKRVKADDEVHEMVNKAGTVLNGLFRRSEAVSQEYEVLVEYLRGKGRLKPGVSIWRKTAEQVLERMVGSGVVVCVADGLYSLASLAPPLGSGSGSAGSGADYSGSRNIPVEPDLKPEPEIEETYVSPTGPTGTRAPSSSASVATSASGIGAGRGGASEASGRILREGDRARCIKPHSADPPEVYLAEDGLLHSPEDVWHVADPLFAAEALLKTLKGWSEVKTDSGPPSTFSLRKWWGDLGKEVGPKERNELWRRCLFKAYEERGYGWRSHVAVFLKGVRVAMECHQSLKSVEKS